MSHWQARVPTEVAQAHFHAYQSPLQFALHKDDNGLEPLGKPFRRCRVAEAVCGVDSVGTGHSFVAVQDHTLESLFVRFVEQRSDQGAANAMATKS